jgi:uncharacterized protein (TIGR03000 family)
VLYLLLLTSRNGLAQSYYSSPNAGLPTYMTSINFPRIYGSFEYPRPMGPIQAGGAQQSPFTTSPTLYSVQTVPPSAFSPGENHLIAATTPLQTTAFVTVWVPADAELRFEGIRTDLRGSFRRFTTPPLVAGREYTYDIQAIWTEGGQQVTKTRHVPVRAGDRLYVDFRTPQTGEEGTRSLRTRPLP